MIYNKYNFYTAHAVVIHSNPNIMTCEGLLASSWQNPQTAPPSV